MSTVIYCCKKLVNLSTRQLVNSSTTTHDLLLQATCKLVNLSTRQLQIMITDVNYQ